MKIIPRGKIMKTFCNICLYVYIIFLNTEIQCALNPPVVNATIENESSDQPVLNSVVVYNCIDGHKFPNMQTSRTIVCGQSGWNNTNIEYCQREQLCFTGDRG